MLTKYGGTEIAAPGGLGTNAPTAEEVKAEESRSGGFDSQKIQVCNQFHKAVTLTQSLLLLEESVVGSSWKFAQESSEALV